MDSIRAICALWVVMGHFGGPPLTVGSDPTSTLAYYVQGVVNNLWSGPSAVIVFFVISGFCIHYPHSADLGLQSSVRAFWIRRFARIGVPMVCAIALASPLQVNLDLFERTILWSLLAELIYYALYPVLLRVRTWSGSWAPLVFGAYLAALGVIWTDPGAGDYPSYGFHLNWLLGLPCWLLGCVLAEKWPSIAAIVDRFGAFGSNIWVWRLAVWAAATTCSVLRFHSPVGYPWTLDLFALMVTVYLSLEIRHFIANPPPRVLEWAGLWSYSLYLTHGMAHKALQTVPLPKLGYLLDWIVMMAAILLFAYVFYRVVERPSHALARGMARRFMRSDQFRSSPSVVPKGIA